jgi:Ran GTPase-activating protein (RanGAP) involved in mRNA processing and transport
MKLKSYTEQASEIEKLCKSISDKANKFSERDHKSPYFEDLLYLIKELKELESSMNTN